MLAQALSNFSYPRLGAVPRAALGGASFSQWLHGNEGTRAVESWLEVLREVARERDAAVDAADGVQLINRSGLCFMPRLAPPGWLRTRLRFRLCNSPAPAINAQVEFDCT